MRLMAPAGIPISALTTVVTPSSLRILQAATLKGLHLQFSRVILKAEVEVVWRIKQKDTFTNKMAPAVTLTFTPTVGGTLASSRKCKRRSNMCRRCGRMNRTSQAHNTTSKRRVDGLQVTVPKKISSLRGSYSSINPKSERQLTCSATTSSPQMLSSPPQDELTKLTSWAKLQRHLF